MKIDTRRYIFASIVAINCVVTASCRSRTSSESNSLAADTESSGLNIKEKAIVAQMVGRYGIGKNTDAHIIAITFDSGSKMFKLDLADVKLKSGKKPAEPVSLPIARVQSDKAIKAVFGFGANNYITRIYTNDLGDQRQVTEYTGDLATFEFLIDGRIVLTLGEQDPPSASSDGSIHYGNFQNLYYYPKRISAEN